MKSEQNDGILLGASKQEQLLQNLEAAKKGPLSENIVSAMDEAWEIAKPDSPAYFKFI